MQRQSFLGMPPNLDSVRTIYIGLKHTEICPSPSYFFLFLISLFGYLLIIINPPQTSGCPSSRAAAHDRCDGSAAPVERVPCPFRQLFPLDLNGTVAVRVRSATAR
jgi:hypothetical protein